MDHALVAAVAFLAAGLTLYSGFGLGTVLLPVFALFFPVEVAVAATAVVHAANNVFKIGVVGRHTDWSLVVRFGVPAVLAAFLGAALLGLISGTRPLLVWWFLGRVAVVTPLGLVLGALMTLFALFELLPALRRLEFGRGHLMAGGLLSGFFGGLSGHQGALRSAFLVKLRLETPVFVGSTAVISFLVDAMRLLVYAATFFLLGTGIPIGTEEGPLVLTAIAAAFAGVYLGSRNIAKVTMRTVQIITGTLLLIIGVVVAAGLI